MGKKTIKGENDLKTWCENNGEWGKQIEDEWVGKDAEGNPVSIDCIACKSSKKVKWKCRSCNNTWVATIANRTDQGNECNICRVSLAKWCDSNGEYGKQLKNEWTGKYYSGDMIKETTMEKVVRLSNNKYIWKCQHCGKEYIVSAFRRIMYNENCPKCSGDTNICKYEDSLDKWCSDNGKNRSDIRLNWAGELEDGTKVDIRKISIHDDRPVIWKCYKCRIKWMQSVHDRITNLNSCPLCEIKEKYKIEPIEVNGF